jgi:hypothetical protein
MKGTDCSMKRILAMIEEVKPTTFSKCKPSLNYQVSHQLLAAIYFVLMCLFLFEPRSTCQVITNVANLLHILPRYL